MDNQLVASNTVTLCSFVGVFDQTNMTDYAPKAQQTLYNLSCGNSLIIEPTKSDDVDDDEELLSVLHRQIGTSNIGMGQDVKEGETALPISIQIACGFDMVAMTLVWLKYLHKTFSTLDSENQDAVRHSSTTTFLLNVFGASKLSKEWLEHLKTYLNLAMYQCKSSNSPPNPNKDEHWLDILERLAAKNPVEVLSDNEQIEWVYINLYRMLSKTTFYIYHDDKVDELDNFPINEDSEGIALANLTNKCDVFTFYTEDYMANRNFSRMF